MEVAVVGGGDAALDEGLFTTRFASKVNVIHRRDELRASRILQGARWRTRKWSSTGTRWSKRYWVRTRSPGCGYGTSTGETSEMPLSAAFVFIGQHPNTGFLTGLVPMDAGKHVLVDDWMKTSVPGLFAAGDVRQNSARQVASSVGDGVTAAIAADHYSDAVSRLTAVSRVRRSAPGVCILCAKPPQPRLQVKKGQ
jgi:thioredoxin reductase (NADPH)